MLLGKIKFNNITPENYNKGINKSLLLTYVYLKT